MLKKAMAMVLGAMLLVGSNGMTAAAQEASPYVTEIVEKDGIVFEINTYNDGGVLVETVSVVEDNVSTFSAGSSKLQTLLDISEERNGFKQNIDDISTYTLANPYEFHKSEQSSSNSNCYAGHWGFFEADIINPFHIRAYDGACRGLYSGSGNAKKIQLSETYTFTGVTASVGWPASVSISASEKSATWSSLAYEDCSIATGNRPEFTGVAYQPFFGLTIDSRSDIYIGSSSYPATVSTSANIWDWSL